MARCSKSLTDTEIKKINQDCVLNDGQGLQLRVRRKVDGNFSKIWIFNYYKPLTKKRTQKTIGNYPTISLSQARQIKKYWSTLLFFSPTYYTYFVSSISIFCTKSLVSKK